MTDTLSLPEARKLVLLSQGLPPAKVSGTATDATLATIERLGYIQIDTISVVERAHHHTLWNRNPRYRPGHLDELVEDGQVVNGNHIGEGGGSSILMALEDAMHSRVRAGYGGDDGYAGSYGQQGRRGSAITRQNNREILR